MSAKTESPCPCGSDLDRSSCCGPLLANDRFAHTAEELMRSRYTAFVEQNSPYLLRTWHTRTRPKYLNFEDNPVVWLGLEIHASEQTPGKNQAVVDFTTTYIEAGLLCMLREKSLFLFEADRWFYLKGESQLRRKKLERNKPCPCGSGKKFKRCCNA